MAPRRGRLRAAAAVLLAFPHYPAFVSQGAHDSPPNSWTYVRGLIGSRSKDDAETRRVDGARVELAQPALMDEAIARLAPQVPGQTDVYAIGIAGWAEQDVFIKELEGALAAFGRILPLQDRVAAPGQSRRHGRADTGRGARELRRRGPRRRAHDGPAQDVLVLFMTSHGSTDGIALRLPGLISTGSRPEDVAGVLDREGIGTASSWCRPAILACSCKPLANDDTIVLTAAERRAPRSAVRNEREWTYFGDALFNQHLRPEVTLEEAFRDARVTIDAWEARDGWSRRFRRRLGPH